MLWPGLDASGSTADTLSRYGYHLHADGVIGTPLPYNVKTDDGFTLLVLLCFVVMTVTLATAHGYVGKVAKDFFRPAYSESIDEGTPTPPFLLVMALANCVILGLGAYISLHRIVGGPATTTHPLLLVLLLSAGVMLYFLLKHVAYYVVNSTFFGSKKRQQWTRAMLFCCALEAVLFMPAILLLIYFDISPDNALFYFGFILFLNKMLLFYKSYNIFFLQNRRFLQNILYFCALEIAPLLAFGGAWMAVANLLKVNY